MKQHQQQMTDYNGYFKLTCSLCLIFWGWNLEWNWCWNHWQWPLIKDFSLTFLEEMNFYSLFSSPLSLPYFNLNFNSRLDHTSTWLLISMQYFVINTMHSWLTRHVVCGRTLRNRLYRSLILSSPLFTLGVMYSLYNTESCHCTC